MVEALAEEASDTLTPILLDVTDDDSIAAAVKSIADAIAGGLFGWSTMLGFRSTGPSNSYRFRISKS